MTAAVRLVTAVPAKVAAALAGRRPDARHYARVVSGDADVYKPDGTLLLALRTRAVPAAAWRLAWEAALRVARRTDRRGYAAAGGEAGDGPFHSGPAGFLYARPVGLARDRPADWRRLQILMREMAAAFARARPAEYAAMAAAVAGRVDPACVVPGTPFTTAQANRSARMGCHPDAGNLPGGYGVLAAAGAFAGGLLVFPRFRVAADVRPGDVLIADTLQLHGNTAIAGDRVTVVCYAHRSNLLCPGGPPG
jgi:hypothetical protein